MEIYIRKVFKHDTTHEVSLTIGVWKYFFDYNPYFDVISRNANKKFNVTVNNATDPRFGGEFKALLKEEGDVQIDDLIVFYKYNNVFQLEIIKTNDLRYKGLSYFFQGDKRHMIINIP